MNSKSQTNISNFLQTRRDITSTKAASSSEISKNNKMKKVVLYKNHRGIIYSFIGLKNIIDVISKLSKTEAEFLSQLIKTQPYRSLIIPFRASMPSYKAFARAIRFVSSIEMHIETLDSTFIDKIKYFQIVMRDGCQDVLRKSQIHFQISNSVHHSKMEVFDQFILHLKNIADNQKKTSGFKIELDTLEIVQYSNYNIARYIQFAQSMLSVFKVKKLSLENFNKDMLTTHQELNLNCIQELKFKQLEMSWQDSHINTTEIKVVDFTLMNNLQKLSFNFDGQLEKNKSVWQSIDEFIFQPTLRSLKVETDVFSIDIGEEIISKVKASNIHTFYYGARSCCNFNCNMKTIKISEILQTFKKLQCENVTISLYSDFSIEFPTYLIEPEDEETEGNEKLKTTTWNRLKKFSQFFTEKQIWFANHYNKIIGVDSTQFKLVQLYINNNPINLRMAECLKFEYKEFQQSPKRTIVIEIPYWKPNQFEITRQMLYDAEHEQPKRKQLPWK